MEHEERLKAALADRYQIEREIGSGGMATVYLARDLKHHRQVAIKVLRPELSATLGPDRFVREIEIAAKLSHPHVLPLHDSGEAEGILYYVMPYVEGESLRERLDREGKLSVAEAVRLTDEIASALGYAHEHGVVHRDVKPENILLSGGRAVVADFGIGRAVTAAGGDRLTGTGFVVGTPAYMSPEQAFGDVNVDARSDVYALGCVAYEMVSGHPPFEADTPQALFAKQAAETVPSLRASDPAVPVFFERAVEKALAKQPPDRFQTAVEFAEALTSEMVVARVGGRRWRQRAGAAAAVAVGLLAGAWWLFTLGAGPSYERLAVLAPINLLNDADQEHIIQGMLNGLISELGQAGITIIGSVQTMMRYRDSQMTPREIAAEMDVDAVLESFVLWRGDSVAIDVRLTDGHTEESLWSHSYDEDARNVLLLYRQVTGAVADEIHAELTPQAEAHLASARPVNPQAYEAYLKGMFHAQRFTPTDLDQALEYFRQASMLDSTYALAQAGIAIVWMNRASMELTTPREAEEQASVAVQQAMALDSTIAEVQYVAAGVRHWLEWDWAGAEAAYLRAIEINPKYPAGRGYAILLTWLGRPDEARTQVERVLELDPFNALYRALNGRLLCYEGRYAQAIEELQAALRIQPDNPVAYGGLAWAYHMTGNYEEALALIRRLFPGGQELDEAIDRGYAEGGYRAALRRYAETLATRPGAAQRLPWTVANIYAWAGEKERALEWLEFAYQAHALNLPAFNSDDFDLVHDDPRYYDLRRRMNLPMAIEGE
jgi:TolB-like protein/tRNA A-37 threonylcarbamoyl transferase component Bud32/Flp pilus assembly protein TadD